MVNAVYGENNLMLKKTRLKKAMDNDFKHEHPFHNLNESINSEMNDKKKKRRKFRAKFLSQKPQSVI